MASAEVTVKNRNRNRHRNRRNCNDSFFYNNNGQSCDDDDDGDDQNRGHDHDHGHGHDRVYHSVSLDDRNRLHSCHGGDDYYFQNMTYKSLLKLFLLYEISYSRADRMLWDHDLISENVR